MLVVSIHNAHQHSEHRFDAPEISLGRSLQANGPHATIEDPLVSRRQLVLRQVSDVALTLENVGRAKAVLADGRVLRTGEQSKLPLPARLKCGHTEISLTALLEDSLDDEDVLASASATFHALPLPVPFSAPSAAHHTLERLGDTPAPERLAAWFETLLSVQRAAAGSAEFYEETARALVELVGLDRGLVMLREQGAWSPVAGHAKNEHIGLHFSRSVLAKLLDEKRTLYGNADEIASGASLTRVEAVVASPILNERQEVVGALFGSRDLVSSGPRFELRPLEAQMVQILAGAVSAGLTRVRMQEKLQASEQLAAVGQALGYIIHDLRGPLGNTRQLLGMLRDGDTRTFDQGEQLDLIGQLVEVSLDLLNDSLEFCRGQVRVTPIRGPVWELLDKHLQLLRMDLAALQVMLRIEVPSQLQATLDPARIARVLRNLAKNAGEALAGRPNAVVEIGAREARGGVELWVADNGPGLPEQVRDRLFQPFATHGKRGGTGFGLAIAKQLVEAHRGKISVSTGSQGTRFSIFLPESFAPTSFVGSLATAGLAVARPLSPDSDTSVGERKRLLLAEDGTVNQRLISGVLRNAGHDVTIASDGQQALAAWESGRFDLVLMDLEMPTMGGLEATEAIRAREQGGRRRTPIVALSAHETDSMRVACRQASMDGYLEKPVRPEELLRLIEELCGLAASK